MPAVPAAKNGNGDAAPIWRWIAAVMLAFVVGLTPYLLSSRNYVEKDEVAGLTASLTALSERVARNEEQIEQVTDSVGALLEIAQTGETRLSEIEAVLARIEATLTVQPQEVTP